MKRIVAMLLCVATVLLCACTGPAASDEAQTTGSTEPTDYQMIVDPKTPLSDGKTIKILTISSSFGLNTTEYLYEIATAQGATDVMIGRLFLAECTLRTHVKNIQQDSLVYRYYKKDSEEPWVVTENVSMLHGLQDEQWDIIFLQHSAEGAAKPDTYGDQVNGDYLDILIGYIQRNKTNPDSRFVWNMTWAFPQDSTAGTFISLGSDQVKMFETIVDGVEQHVLPRTDFAAIIPSGTAIQNARSSYFGDTLNSDEMHLNALGKVVAGYATFAVLTGKPLDSVNLETAGSNLVLTASDQAVILDAVNNAFEKPFEITPSAYPERP